MVKKLRWRFCLFAVGAVTAVLLVIIGVIITISFHAVTAQADKVLLILKENNGEFGIDTYQKKTPFTTIDGDTPYETRYFAVYYDKSGSINKINIKKIATVFVEDAVTYANKVYSKNNEKGYIKTYRYLKYETDVGTTILFMDCGKQRSTIQSFILSSLFVSLTGLLTVGVLLYIFSPQILRPIIDSYEKQKKFITNASHELKTPLTVITANNEILSMMYGENECIDTIDKQVNKLVIMTNNLVMLSRIDEKSTNLEKIPFSLTEAAFDIMNEFSKTCLQQFTFDIEENITYNGDEKLIRDLLIVIVDNAKKYAKSIITFKLQKNKNQINISISNDTNGIPAGNLLYLTERFFRLDDTRGSGIDGSGIGLSVAKEVVDLHKGSMKIYSNDGINFNIEIIL